MKTVQDALDAKGSEVHWIDPLASVFDAAKMMNAHRVGALLVQIDGFLVGIVSERDYVTKVILDRAASQRTKVSEIMTRDVITVGRDESLDRCIELMRFGHFRHLPVVQDGRPVGIISLRDLFLAAVEPA
ncbi:MAG: CBS domain-containing protein [Pseudomonadota bacterium]|nr:CBS domain-containing protein [Pseudomonadota bacterium]